MTKKELERENEMLYNEVKYLRLIITKKELERENEMLHNEVKYLRKLIELRWQTPITINLESQEEQQEPLDLTTKIEWSVPAGPYTGDPIYRQSETICQVG